MEYISNLILGYPTKNIMIFFQIESCEAFTKRPGGGGPIEDAVRGSWHESGL